MQYLVLDVVTTKQPELIPATAGKLKRVLSMFFSIQTVTPVVNFKVMPLTTSKLGESGLLG